MAVVWGVIDASHAFGVRYRGESILNHGDISILSFHATKLFHTIEGGALIINDDELVQKARYLINFGIENAESIPELGTNAKMNEFEAAMGLCMLEEMDNVFAGRRRVIEEYLRALEGSVVFQRHHPEATRNYAYFPILLESEAMLKKIQKALNEARVFPRRYFYPSLDSLGYIEPKQNCPVSRDISKRILALPVYPELSEEDQKMIIDIIKRKLEE